MSIPHVFLPVRPQDFTVTPFKTYKRFIISDTDYEALGYTLREALYTRLKTPISSSKANNDPRNIDGSYKHIEWQSINHRYYRNPYDPTATMEHSNENRTYKKLFLTASVFTVPYMDFGEQIKPGSFEITGSNGIRLQDDGRGNLYDPTIVTSSISNLRKHVAMHWSPNALFKNTKYGISGSLIRQAPFKYISRTFSPPERSVLKNGRLITYNNGQILTDFTASGHGVNLIDDSYIYTRHRKDFNFTEQYDNWSILFWFTPKDGYTGSAQIPLVDKSAYITKQVYGKNPKPNANGIMVNTEFVSQSVEYIPTNVYPYKFTFDGSTNIPYFHRSDGINSVSMALTPSASFDHPNMCVIVKSGSSFTSYLNGQEIASVADTTGFCANNYDLIFGSHPDNPNVPSRFDFCDLKFLTTGIDSSEVSRLYSQGGPSIPDTPIVGNVFYKSGVVVISTPNTNRDYATALSGSDWNVKFRATHTIYQNEVLCRIKKGDANMSQNPTARINPESDILIDDMTGSLLRPYATAIGLYTPEGDLVAVGKLGQPLQMRDDTDINIYIRFDI